jgi:hypothetical protein
MQGQIPPRKEVYKRTLVLPVERTTTTAPAERVGLGVSLTARDIFNRMRDTPDRRENTTHPKDEVPD